MSKRLLILISVGMLLRVVHVFALVPFVQFALGLDLYNFIDGDGYLNYSQGVHSGAYWFGDEYLRRMPLYPSMLAFFTLLPFRDLVEAQVLNILLDTLTLACVYMAVRKLAGEPAALFAGVCYAVYPLAVYRLAMVGTEVIHTTALAFFVLGVLRFWQTQKPLDAVWLSLLTAVILFITPVFQFFVIFAVCALFYLFHGRKALVLSLAYVVPVVALALLWGVRNYEAAGEYYLFDIRGGKEFWLGNNVESNGEWEGPFREIWEKEFHQDKNRILKQGGTLNDVNRNFYKKGIQEILTHPDEAAVLWGKKFFRFWYIPASKRMVELTIPIQTFFLALGFYGLWQGWRQNRQLVMLVPIIGYYTAIYTASYACIRFSHPIMPWVCACAGIGLYALYTGYWRPTHYEK